MIQLSGIQIISMNQPGKLARKEGELDTGFDAVLQLIGQMEEKEAESMELVNQLFLPQLHPLMDPLSKPMVVESFPSQGEPIVAKQVVDHSVLQSFKNEPPPSAENIGELRTDAVTFFKVTEEMDTATDENVKGLAGLIQISEDSGQSESQHAVPHNKNSPIEFIPLTHSTPMNQSNISSENVIPATQTVHADQFDQEITKFLQSSINVTGTGDGIEAAFTLTPEHLGKVDVKVTIQDGKLTAEFLTSTPLGKELLETHIQALRSALETQGLQVGKIDITQQTSTQLSFMGAFSQKGDSNGRPGQQDSRKRSESVQLTAQEDYRDYITDPGWVSQINTTV